MPKVSWMLSLAAVCLLCAPSAEAAAPCGTSTPLIALGTEATDDVRLGVATSRLTTTVCRSGLVEQAETVDDSRAYAPFFTAVRNPQANLATLRAALAAGHIGGVASCTVPALSKRSTDLMVVKWFGAHGRENRFLFQRGASELFPVCSPAEAALFEALRSFESGVASDGGAEVLHF